MKKAKENWIGEQCSEIEENLRKNNSKRAYQLVIDLTTVKQGKATTLQDRSGKCLTEERQILNRWTEYCSEVYNYKANGDPSVLNCPQTDTEDDSPILRREVEAAVQSLKKGKSAGVDNISAELVQAGGRMYLPLSRQSATRFGRQENGQPHGPSSLSSHFPRKATRSSARTTEQSASSVTQSKSC